MRIKLFYEVFLDVLLIEELLWDKMFLLEEPYEDETCDETDATLMVELVIVCIGSEVVVEACHLNSPCIPVGQFAIELLCEQFAGEHLYPMFI